MTDGAEQPERGPAVAGTPEGDPLSAAGKRDREDLPEMVRKLAERKARHKQRGRLQRAGVVILGVLLVVAGIVLSGPGIPGPGFAVILVGLAFLALEFDRAERLLEWVLVKADDAKDRASRATRTEKAVAAVVALIVVGACVAAALLWDIPFLPV